MRKYWFLLILLLISTTKIYADDITFAINAPNATVNGAQIQLQYVLRGGSANDINGPDNIKGFDVLFGPSVSRVYSSSYSNGQTTTENSTTFTYVLMAKEEGTFTLPAATVKVNGRNYTSQTKQIKVLPPDKNVKPQQSGSQPQITNSTSSGANLNPNDAFVKAIFSKTKVNEQEAVVVTFRFYSVLNIRDVGKIQFPEFEGFMAEEIELPVNRQLIAERYNGKNYYTIDVKKTLLFPQRSGKMTIPSGTMDIVFEVPSGQKVRTFLGVQEVMTEVRKVLKSPPVTVDVSPLPTNGKPANFSGAVGTFALNSSITGQKVKANDAITLKLDITGSGNMKLIKNPEIILPKDFEAYDPKINNDFKVTDKGLSGTKSIEYLFIPRHPGQYTIPKMELSYYDTNSKSYKTLKSQAYTIDVDKDSRVGSNAATSYMNQQDVEVEQDIRYLKKGEFSFKNQSDFLIGSWGYILWYIIPIMLFTGLMIFYRQQVKANSNISLTRTKKANKVAAKRLKLANKYLLQKDKDKFYEEVLRAVWGYLSDKLTIPVASLNRENVETELIKYGVDQALIAEFISILDTCEFARYAPAESNKAMDNLYNETVSAIGKMESVIKIK